MASGRLPGAGADDRKSTPPQWMAGSRWWRLQSHFIYAACRQRVHPAADPATMRAPRNGAAVFCRAALQCRSRGAAVRSPRPVGGQTSQAPGCSGKTRGSGPDAAKPFCESGLGRWPDLTSAQVRAQTAEQGVRAPATVKGQRSTGRSLERPAPPLTSGGKPPRGSGCCETTAQAESVAQVRLARREPGQPRLRLSFREGVPSLRYSLGVDPDG
jgi:hypothetical protein